MALRKREKTALLPASLEHRILALSFAGAVAAAFLVWLSVTEWSEQRHDIAQAESVGWALQAAAALAREDKLSAGPIEHSSVWASLAPPEKAEKYTTRQTLTLPSMLADQGMALEVHIASGRLADSAVASLIRAPTELAYFGGLSRELTLLGRASFLALSFGDGRKAFFICPDLWQERTAPVTLALLIILAATAIFILLAWGAQVLAHPFKSLARIIEHRGEDVQVPLLPEAGPLEVQAMIRADNRLRQRIASIMTDQTRMLAAVSHDLRTPSTRLRLRAELVPDPDLRQPMLRDLDEMDAMLAEVLEFLSHEVREEALKLVDLTALLQSVCDDYADLGRPVTLREPPPLTFHGVPTLFASTQQEHIFRAERKIRQSCRPTALRRALCNLIDNALKYGHRADLTLNANSEIVRIEINDVGPGIPEAETENVFLPLYRLESSRQRSTGGMGLGLAIVKAAVSAHHGRIELRNRSEGGLSVCIELPRSVS